MSGIAFRYLAYLGPDRPAAALSFERGLNVVCGASETGKSFVVESIDFMLGQRDPVRDIPERNGYDHIRLEIESAGWPPLTLDRSVEGGNFRAYEEQLTNGAPRTGEILLRWQHSAARQDTLSYVLLERIGLASKTLRRSATETRSLTFRDLARLCVVTEEEIQRQGSPLLSGQVISRTGEYAAFKLLLTGTDDSALVLVKERVARRDQEAGKIELLDQMIGDLQANLDEEGADENELKDQLAQLDLNIARQNEALKDVQRALDDLLRRRGIAASELRKRNARLLEIEELTNRFQLLDSHYESDVRRLQAIRESGSLFVHLEQEPCPLCGALPGDQHLDTDCEGNTEAVVRASEAEMLKIQRLRGELDDTIKTLRLEREDLQGSLAEFESEYKDAEKQLSEIAAPAVTTERASYDELVSERAEVRVMLDKIERLNSLLAQRAALENEEPAPGESGASRTQVPTNVLDEFAKTIQRILEEWHYPNATRVFFDEGKRDIQIAGKDRGSTGKGLRAITHAAVTIGLMEFCREHELPHPGFVVLDSPLLAYWKPEGDEDDLRGTDLKERFYRYLLGLNKRDNQVLIIENEHPPRFVYEEASVMTFTKNPHHGRYGFFPHTG